MPAPFRNLTAPRPRPTTPFEFRSAEANDGTAWGLIDRDDPQSTRLPAEKATLAELLQRDRRFHYDYVYGEDWTHTVELEAITSAAPDTKWASRMWKPALWCEAPIMRMTRMRRRSVSLLAMFRALVLSALTAVAIAHGAEPVSSPMDRRVAELRKSPLELHAFLYAMPKGADLHNHLSGAIYAEGFLAAAVAEHLCVDQTALALVPCAPGQVDAAAIETDNTLRNALIDSFSMRNFVAGKQSGHDHFFETFDKFGAVGSGNLIAEVAQRAADLSDDRYRAGLVRTGTLRRPLERR